MNKDKYFIVFWCLIGVLVYYYGGFYDNAHITRQELKDMEARSYCYTLSRERSHFITAIHTLDGRPCEQVCKEVKYKTGRKESSMSAIGGVRVFGRNDNIPKNIKTNHPITGGISTYKVDHDYNYCCCQASKLNLYHMDIDSEEDLPVFMAPNIKPISNRRSAASTTTKKERGKKIVDSSNQIVPIVDPFSCLHKDLSIKILTFFQYNEICLISRVNKLWKSLCSNDFLWCQLYQTDFNKTVTSIDPKKRGKGSKKNNKNKKHQRVWKEMYIMTKKGLQTSRHEALMNAYRVVLNCDHKNPIIEKVGTAVQTNTERIQITCEGCQKIILALFSRENTPKLIELISDRSYRRYYY